MKNSIESKYNCDLKRKEQQLLGTIQLIYSSFLRDFATDVTTPNAHLNNLIEIYDKYFITFILFVVFYLRK